MYFIVEFVMRNLKTIIMSLIMSVIFGIGLKGYFYINGLKNKIEKQKETIKEKNIEINNLKIEIQYLKDKFKNENFNTKYKYLKECLKQKEKELKEKMKEEENETIDTSIGYHTITIP